MSKLSPKVVHHLAQYVFSHICNDNAWELHAGQDQAVAVIEQAIAQNLSEEDALVSEAKKLLAAQLAKVKGAEIDEHKALLLIKKQLAKQKKFIL